MKYLNLAFVALFSVCIISCGEKSKTVQVEEIEAVEIDDEDELIDIESDESDYINSAIESLESGDTDKAVSELLNAITIIKDYTNEMDDPSEAKTAVVTLSNIVTDIKNGKVMSANDLQKTIFSMGFFADDDMEDEDLDEESIDE